MWLRPFKKRKRLGCIDVLARRLVYALDVVTFYTCRRTFWSYRAALNDNGFHERETGRTGIVALLGLKVST